MGRLAVGHRERLEIESLSLCPLPEQFPIMTTGVDRRYQTPGHRRMEHVRPQQSSERLAGENQSSTQLKHLTRTEPSGSAYNRFRSIVDNVSRAESLDVDLWWHESEQFALFASMRTNAFTVVEDLKRLKDMARLIVCRVATIDAGAGFDWQAVTIEDDVLHTHP